MSKNILLFAVLSLMPWGDGIVLLRSCSRLNRVENLLRKTGLIYASHDTGEKRDKAYEPTNCNSDYLVSPLVLDAHIEGAVHNGDRSLALKTETDYVLYAITVNFNGQVCECVV